MAKMPVVLVVEDEPTVQQTLCTALTVMGFRALRAGDVEAALKIIDTEQIDAFSLDIRIPDPKGLQRTGLSLLTHVRSKQEHATTPVLVFTGMPLSVEDLDLVELHRAQLFYKPERYSVVIAELQRLLQEASAA
jgi:DNA-binding response OmpR family regulator